MWKIAEDQLWASKSGIPWVIKHGEARTLLMMFVYKLHLVRKLISFGAGVGREKNSTCYKDDRKIVFLCKTNHIFRKRVRGD